MDYITFLGKAMVPYLHELCFTGLKNTNPKKTESSRSRGLLLDTVFWSAVSVKMRKNSVAKKEVVKQFFVEGQKE